MSGFRLGPAPQAGTILPNGIRKIAVSAAIAAPIAGASVTIPGTSDVAWAVRTGGLPSSMTSSDGRKSLVDTGVSVGL